MFPELTKFMQKYRGGTFTVSVSQYDGRGFNEFTLYWSNGKKEILSVERFRELWHLGHIELFKEGD